MQFYMIIFRKRKQDTPQESRNSKMKNQRPINAYFEPNSEHKTPNKTRDNGVSVSMKIFSILYTNSEKYSWRQRQFV